jgi:hypothetical protein
MASPLFFQLPISWHEQHSTAFYVERCDLRWANDWIQRFHYLHTPVSSLACPFSYSIHATDGQVIGVVILALPHFTKAKGLFGYPGLPTQWQILLISRLWIDPAFQNKTIIDSNGNEHSLCVASCAIAQIVKRVNQDWLEHHPPPFPHLPYNLRLLISYADYDWGHKGIVYQASNFAFSQVVVSDRKSRHSSDRLQEERPLIRYFVPLRRVFDPLQNRFVRWSIPREWLDLEATSKKRLREAFNELEAATYG